MEFSPQARGTVEGALPVALVRDQLSRILASDLFSRSERLGAFLRFVVEETVAGRGGELKEQVLAARLYGRSPGSAGGDDAVVRVDARRLRDKLREYYQAATAADAVRIEIPKGSYEARFSLLALRTEETPDADRPSIVVLPFEDLSADPGQEYFADGMTDGVIMELARFNVLRVISRTSAMSYKRVHKPVRDIARELNVSHVLEGTVIRVPGRIRVACQLLRADPEAHLWAQSFDRDLCDVLEMLSEIARTVAAQVLRFLAPSKSGGQGRTIAPQAYEAYLRGRYHCHRLTPPDLYQSLDFFQAALAHDRTYAPAWAGMASAYVLLGEQNITPSKESHPKARTAAHRALELDPNLAEAWNALAGVAAGYEWDWAEAEACFRRALELNSNYALAHMLYGSFLGHLGRFEDAVRENRTAHELDPLSVAVEGEYGMILYQARRYEEAVVQLQATLRADPAFPLAYIYLGLTLLALKRIPEAIEVVKKGRAIAPLMPSFPSMLAFAYGKRRQRRLALQTLEEMEALGASHYVPEIVLAVAVLGLGDHDRAIFYLEKAYDERNWLMRVIGTTPMFDDVRRDPRFTDILKRMNLPPGADGGSV